MAGPRIELCVRIAVAAADNSSVTARKLRAALDDFRALSGETFLD